GAAARSESGLSSATRDNAITRGSGSTSAAKREPVRAAAASHPAIGLLRAVAADLVGIGTERSLDVRGQPVDAAAVVVGQPRGVELGRATDPAVAGHEKLLVIPGRARGHHRVVAEAAPRLHPWISACVIDEIGRASGREGGSLAVWVGRWREPRCRRLVWER